MPKDIDLKSKSKVSAVQRQATPAETDSAAQNARDAVNLAGVGASSKPPVTPEAIEQIIQAGSAKRRVSHLEKTYGQFYDETIDAADKSRDGSGSLMRDLNRIFSICHGMATVMRIASGNDVLEDFHDPDDRDSELPLSSAAINSLTTMTAAVCEWIADDISRTADHFNGRGDQA